MKKIILLLLLSLFAFGNLDAQSSVTERIYNQTIKPVAIDNYSHTAYFRNGRSIYNLRANTLCVTKGTITSFKINPSGVAFAVMTKRSDYPEISIYNMWDVNSLYHRFKLDYLPLSMAYAPDSKIFAVAASNYMLYLYDSKEYKLQRSFRMTCAPTNIAISANNYFVAGASGSKIFVYNLEDGSVRKEIQLDSKVTSFIFSDDCSYLIATTANGNMYVYDTRSFSVMQSFDALGDALACDLHDDGKYIAVVTADSRIALINKFDASDRLYVDYSDGGISDVRFVHDAAGNMFLLYNTSNAIVYTPVEGIKPHYSQLLADELNDRMNVWMKQMDGESLAEYELRVNEESRVEQMKLYEQEIATRMADNLLSASEVTLGNFNPETNMLSLDFNTMPSIYLSLPDDKVQEFMDVEALEFRNEVYGLRADDTFELVYVDVYNTKTGETYTFDNRERRSLDYLKLDESFVSLDLIHMSNMDEMKLNEIKENVMAMAVKEEKISNHTHIDVSANVVPTVDANGNSILNYEIGYAYDVEEEFSAKDDFAPGRYMIEQSEAAKSMLQIIQTSFEKDFAKYIQSGKKLKVQITGMADRLPINGKIAYSGVYGDYVNEPVWGGNGLYALTVTEESGITENDQLAFIRAVGLKSALEKCIPSISDMNVDYEYHIKLSDKTGGEYRRISVKFIFVNAL